MGITYFCFVKHSSYFDNNVWKWLELISSKNIRDNTF